MKKSNPFLDVLACLACLAVQCFSATSDSGPPRLTLNPSGTGAGNTGELRFKELSANGASHVGLKAPDSIAANVIWTLPNADGSSGQVLKTNGSGVLSWTTPGGVSSIGSGTSGAESASSGLTFSADPISTSGTIAIANSGVTTARIAAGAVDLTTKVSSILPGANGGTNNGFMQFSGPATSAKTFTLPNASASILTTNAAVTVAQGGTGAVSFPANGLLFGNGASAIGALSAPIANQFLIGNGTPAPAWATLSGDATLSGNNGTLTIANDAITTAKIADANVTLGKLESRARPVENILINGGFDFCQRIDGTSGTYTGFNSYGYTFDRWKAYTGFAASAARFDTKDTTLQNGLQNRYYGAYKQTTGTAKIIAFQIIEGRETAALRGRTVTFQIKMKASSAKTMRIALLQNATAATMDSVTATMVSAPGADGEEPTFGTNLTTRIAVTGVTNCTSEDNGGTCSVTTGWQQFSVTGTVPTDCENLIVAFWTDNAFAVNDVVYVAEAGLYDGSEVRDWLPRPAGQELALCQRYCYVPTTPNLFGTVYRAGTQAIRGWFALPVTMRVAPTGSSNISGWDNDGSPLTTDMSMWNELVGAYVTISGGLTVNVGGDTRSWFIQAVAGTSFSTSSNQLGWLVAGLDVKIILSAEL